MSKLIVPSVGIPSWVRETDIPPLHMVRMPEKDEGQPVDSAAEATVTALGRSCRLASLPEGASVAVTVGSRGIAGLTETVAAAVNWLKQRGFKPFIVPAMGSHGGATAEGQAGVLEALGVSQATVGAPIRATMETVDYGVTSQGIRSHFDAAAAKADAILLINRVKSHTSFERPVESGLIKMLAVGLGKAEGARNVHRLGVRGLAEVLPELAAIALKNAPVAYGLALVENRNKQLASIDGIEPEDFFMVEERLLKQAKNHLALLPFNQLDVLVVTWMGKNISGIGMDYAVTGRTDIRGLANPATPFVTKLAVLRLTPESHGNAMGLGLADFTTKALVESLDLTTLYTNAMTSTFVEKGKLPLALPTEREAIQAALATCWRREGEPVRMAVIRSTLALDRFLVSEPLAQELIERGFITEMEPAAPLPLTEKGDLADVF
ncbi:DUF362 domain-containing protein [Oceanidesulfovibrio marinus]|uniref:LarA-like N-terminal domain-containing protein n=1 Tax=Oceanidesulfovibrio marinus TaxID=370038 RepID=A0ABX6NCT9_9BACT|nr:DUF362 domain-containing protein [Oceanidesulfovibrio marinus]QJT08004.1 hypothetical protein E8L03_03255 [Oceanidesulfovibrio marinus]